ncbi:hypothetical protein [Skermanella pratensis]|nr:hypothetical protein [Skermanella pratensis]
MKGDDRGRLLDKVAEANGWPKAATAPDIGLPGPDRVVDKVDALGW